MSLITLLLTADTAMADAVTAAKALLAKLEGEAEFKVRNSGGYATLLGDVDDAIVALDNANNAIVYPTVTVNDVVYDIIHPSIRKNNVLITAEAISAEGDDGTIATELVAAGSNMLVPPAP